MTVHRTRTHTPCPRRPPPEPPHGSSVAPKSAVPTPVCSRPIETGGGDVGVGAARRSAVSSPPLVAKILQASQTHARMGHRCHKAEAATHHGDEVGPRLPHRASAQRAPLPLCTRSSNGVNEDAHRPRSPARHATKHHPLNLRIRGQDTHRRRGPRSTPRSPSTPSSRSSRRPTRPTSAPR